MDNITRLKNVLEDMDTYHEVLRIEGLDRFINFYTYNQIRIVLEDLHKQEESGAENGN